MSPTLSPLSSGVDRGAVDVSLHMLVGSIALLVAILGVAEGVTFWHTRNVLDEAATEGVRVAAAYDGTCEQGIRAASSMAERIAPGWARHVTVSCLTGDVVTVEVIGRAPGPLGWSIAVSESAPKER